MLIKALCEYADKLEESGVKLNTGWSDVGISYRIFLNPDGSISDIVDVQDSNGKSGKPVVRRVELPDRTDEKGGNPTVTCSYIIEHRPTYIFGVEYNKGEYVLTGKSKKQHAAFIKRNLEFFEDIDSEICKAYVNFINLWNPETETDNSFLKTLKNLSGGCGWSLSGGRGNLENDEQFIKKYSEYVEGRTEAGDASEPEITTCGILGEELPVARVHNVVKLPIGQKPDHRLVCMKEPAFNSYGKTQSNNSNISQAAMKKYTAALNKLMSDKAHYNIVQDTLIVFFAIKSDDTAECKLLSTLMGDADEQAEENLYRIYDGIRKGTVDYSSFNVDENVTFYTVGLTSCYPRVSQKFIYRDRFANIIDNLIQHQRDFMVDENAERQVYFSAIAHELVSPKSKNETVPPPLISGIMIAALKGTNYPSALLASVVRRVKTDSDEDKNHYIKLNSTRAGIIKACINRKLRNSGQKEEITMAWDETNLNPAYICGGLFAVYEKIQREAAGVDLNRTIKDTYFASACSRPSVIFPKLAQLSQNHLRKLEDGRVIYFNKLIGGLIDGLDGRFPQTLDLDSQGRFIIGYYQMNQRLYTPNTGKND